MLFCFRQVKEDFSHSLTVLCFIK